MRVWAQYATRGFGLFRPRYLLHVKGEAGADELRLIRRHRMHGDELYMGRVAAGAEKQAESRFDLAGEVPGFDRAAMKKRRKLRREGLVLALIAAKREARINIGELLKGKSFAARDVVELAETENGVVKGVKALTLKLEKLKAYDSGAEWASVLDEQHDTAAPADWMQRARD